MILKIHPAASVCHPVSHAPSMIVQVAVRHPATAFVAIVSAPRRRPLRQYCRRGQLRAQMLPKEALRLCRIRHLRPFASCVLHAVRPAYTQTLVAFAALAVRQPTLHVSTVFAAVRRAEVVMAQAAQTEELLSPNFGAQFQGMLACASGALCLTVSSQGVERACHAGCSHMACARNMNRMRLLRSILHKGPPRSPALLRTTRACWKASGNGSPCWSTKKRFAVVTHVVH